MRLVILESPFNASTPKGVERNIEYARAAMADCLARGEAPYASHLLYTQEGVLDDKDPAERKLGMAAGFAWAEAVACRSAKTVVYTDRGVSRGMQEGIANASKHHIPIEFRQLGGTWAK